MPEWNTTTCVKCLVSENILLKGGGNVKYYTPHTEHERSKKEYAG